MTEDLDLFFDTSLGDAVQVSINGQTRVALFNTATDVLDGQVLAQAPTLLLPTARAAGFAEGHTAAVNGGSYRVRQVRRQPPDGALTLLVLTKA